MYIVLKLMVHYIYYYCSSLGQIYFYEAIYNVITFHHSMQSAMLSNFYSELIDQCCIFNLATVVLTQMDIRVHNTMQISSLVYYSDLF